MDLVTVWNKKRKRWVNVPAHWVDHPVLGGDFSRDKPTPSAQPKARENSKENQHA